MTLINTDEHKETNEIKPPIMKNFYNIFNKPSDYNEGVFHIMLGDKCVGLAGNKLIDILVDYISLEDLGWLGFELALLECREYGDYVFRSNGFPPVKLIGDRDKKNAVKYYMNALLRKGSYWDKAYGSGELRETIPFTPPVIRRE